jgi:hypothetical protein
MHGNMNVKLIQFIIAASEEYFIITYLRVLNILFKDAVND